MKNILFYLCLVTIFTSCFRERIEIDNNKGDSKKLVITAWLTSDDRPQYVYVNYTSNYLGDEQAERVTDAIVTISDNQTTYTLDETFPGAYTLTDGWEPVVGNSYTLKVIDGEDEYSATQILRACPEIENLRYALSDIDDDGDGEDERRRRNPFSYIIQLLTCRKFLEKEMAISEQPISKIGKR